MRIDEFPTNELDGIQYRCGHVLPFGASVIGNGVIHFSVFSKDATGCTLLLFHAGEKEPFIRIPFPEEFRIGNVYSMIVYGLVSCPKKYVVLRSNTENDFTYEN